ncbi:hypothetical protein [Ruania alba]|uniref:Uncharacterized protein n=1 Tax=Ruania alba TaxID=648782 RepID=A0A1H5ELN1_9MICO|nr:hypothetical protein [Ruania alba]SED91989.1 hypothetical protein SAMN04488554_1062 [Ruania alba]
MPIDLPRSVLTALWVAELRAVGGPHGPGTDELTAAAVPAIQGEDEPHTLIEAPTAEVPLSVGRSGLRTAVPTVLDRLAAHPGVVHAALPVPGEVGVPAPVAQEAIETGEAVVAVGNPGETTVVALPHVQTFGSALEPGAMVTWAVHRCEGNTGVPDSPADARRSLTEALELAIDALTRMDVARWRPEAAEDIAMLASATVPPELHLRLPGGLDGRRLDLLVRAARLNAIVDLATEDDGAAVNVWQVDQRSAAMRHVAAAARRAMVSATVSAPPSTPA